MSRTILAVVLSVAAVGVGRAQPSLEPPPIDPPPSAIEQAGAIEPILEAPPLGPASEPPIDASMPPVETIIVEEPIWTCPCEDDCYEARVPPDHWSVIEFYSQWWKPAPLSGGYRFGPVGQPRPRMPVNLNGSALQDQSRGGFNLLFGSWLNDTKSVGFEAGVSYTGAESDVMFIGGRLLGESPLVPILIAQIEPPEGQDRRLGYLPDTAIGFQETRTHVKLTTSQANLVQLISRGENHQLEALGGFRYFHLGETLYVGQVATPADLRPGEPAVFGAVDRLSTRTDFYGGQVGMRGLIRADKLYLEMTGKLGIGGNQDIVRFRSLTTPGAVGGSPDVDESRVGGNFAMLPELSMRLGFVGGHGAHWFVGYDFLYLSESVRLADFIGPQSSGGRQEFWAHGLKLGVQWTY